METEKRIESSAPDYITHKQYFYNELKTEQNKLQGKGPTYTLGDFSARLQIRYAENEIDIVGPHTFDKHNITLGTATTGVQENRRLFLGNCRQTNTIPANT